MTFLAVIAHVITFQLRLWISGPDEGKTEHQNAALLLLSKNGLLILQKFLKYHFHSPLLLFYQLWHNQPPSPAFMLNNTLSREEPKCVLGIFFKSSPCIFFFTEGMNPFTVVGILPFWLPQLNSSELFRIKHQCKIIPLSKPHNTLLHWLFIRKRKNQQLPGCV